MCFDNFDILNFGYYQSIALIEMELATSELPSAMKTLNLVIK